MRQLYYTIQTLIRGRGSNLIKIISLTLGLFVGILLFASVAFQLSFHNFFRQPELLYLTYMTNIQNGVEGKAFSYTFGPLSAALKENFPKEVENATILRDWGDVVLYNGDTRLQEYMTYGDENLFATLGLKVLAGKPEDLVSPDVIFISHTLAKKIGAMDGELSSVIGKNLYQDRKQPMMVRGVFEDLKENTDISFDVVMPMASLRRDNRAGWGYDISYMAIIRFRDEAGMKTVEARLPDMLKKYMPNFNKRENNRWECSFRPLSDLHSTNPTVRTMVLVMSVLAIVILLIAAFNYVLISVASLARRAKAVGVHKCSGATGGAVFRMFFTETVLIVLLAILLTVLLMFQFRDFVEETTAARLVSLFTWRTLWVPVLVVIAVLLLAGIMPAGLFSSIPVTQVFHRYTERRTAWKRPLLFIQFMGMTFIFGFLIIVLGQYQTVMNKDLGYNPNRVVMCWHQFGNEEGNAKSFFKNLPMVEDYAAAAQMICYGYSGDTFDVGESRMVDARVDWIGVDFVPMMGIPILEGKNIAVEGEILVNEEFVRQARWTDSPIGKRIQYGRRDFIVVGVVGDYAIRSAYHPQEPILLMTSQNPGFNYLRLKEPFEQNLADLNRQMAEAFPTDDVVFLSLPQMLEEQYTDVRRFRNAVVLASISIFLIALMGLIGYTNDEVRYRSKEIAIRKVNGAEASGILRLLSENILWTALPAVIIGALLARFIGNKWLEQFSDSVQLGICAYIGVALLVLALIICTVVFRAWNVANENPVKSIKNE